MRTINIDRRWRFQHNAFMLGDELSGKEGARCVDLPHDYMLEDGVSENAPAAQAMGYYDGKVAYYSKALEIPKEWRGEKVFLHFDGVMMNASLEVNGYQVKQHHYGYTPFWADITSRIYWGEKNRIVVSVNPSMQPNSRWYTGAGIFRSVELVHMPAIRIGNDGIFTYTKRVEWREGEPEEAFVCSEVTVCNDTHADHLVRVEASLIPDGEAQAVTVRSVSIQVNGTGSATAMLPMTVKKPKLWDAENPNLYQMSVTVTDLGEFGCGLSPVGDDPMTDSACVLFGIRTVSADSTHGLQVNGKTVKLKGGCIHHDNGILGAVSLYDSEYRKIKLLKENGFNMVRTAHNPPSAVLLEVCDRLGMYVFDEAFDAWGVAKQPGDYSQFFHREWKEDMSAFILRDRSHPSILIWSTGNEIPERGGMNDGYRLAMELASFVRSLDPTRLVSNGLCSYWSGLDDRTAADNFRKARENSGNATGMEQNAPAPVTDTFIEERSEPFCSFLDVVGYNYMEDHYEIAGKLFPERVILGTESFPMEIDRVWDYVERLPYVIGDCTWTSFDYIGEAGIGKSMFVEPDSPEARMDPWAIGSHTSQYPWRLANDADLDINGQLTPQGVYRRIVWGSDETGLFAADPENFGKTEVISKWGWPQGYENWSWKGKEGQRIRVAVYSAADEVELFLNGTSLGRAAAGKENRYTASFDITYEPGLLEAVSLRGDKEVSRASLKTVGEPAAIRLRAELPAEDSGHSAVKDTAGCGLTADGHSLAYVSVEIVDCEGNLVPDAAVLLKAETEGPGRLLGFGSANPITQENYTTGSFTAWHGRALAVIRSGYEAGEVTLAVKAEGLEAAGISIAVCENDIK